MNFTVIMRKRHHFGDEEDYFSHLDFPGTFVGKRMEPPLVPTPAGLEFDCPGIDPSEVAVLMFQSLDVDHNTNILTINKSNVVGGIPRTVSKDVDEGAWTSNVLLIAADVLRPAGNKLYIESKNESGGEDGNLDDFIIDNMVIFYKTRAGPFIPV